jgi:osmotically-inducible protein OsmY
MIIKLAGGAPTIDAFGVYLAKGERAFGAVPPDVYKNYLREARTDSETTLRLEINSRQYERALKVIKEWERRDREGALLYTTRAQTLDDATYLNNILVVKAVTETLNQCSDDVNLYPLNYIQKDDWISDKVRSALVPFFYFKELRLRNEARHIDDKKFQELVPLPNVASR